MADFLTEVNKPFKVTPVPTLAGGAGSIDPNTPLTWTFDPPEAGTIEPNPDGTQSAIATMPNPTVDAVISCLADANLNADGVQDLVITGTVTATTVAPVIGADGGTLAFEPVV